MKPTALVVLLVICLPVLTMAQYTGPNTSHHPTTVADLLGNSAELLKNKTVVSSLGYVTRQTGEHTFVFKDETAQIDIQIMPDNLPPVPFDDEDKVMLIGRIQGKKVPYLQVSKTIVLHLKSAKEHHERISEMKEEVSEEPDSGESPIDEMKMDEEIEEGSEGDE